MTQLIVLNLVDKDGPYSAAVVAGSFDEALALIASPAPRGVYSSRGAILPESAYPRHGNVARLRLGRN